MTTILHVSDLHFGKPAVLEQIDAIEGAIRAGHFDIVAVSGDFSQRARAGEFQRAAVFLREARKYSRTIAVPGNHDVAWWYAPLGIGARDRVYENYRRYISEELQPTLETPGVFCIGLNTSQGVTSRTLTWNVRDISIIGDLTPGQLADVQQRLARAPAGDLKVIVMHHNPVPGQLSQRYGLKHTREILGAFGDMGVDLVLCGHDHQEAVSYVANSGNRADCRTTNRALTPADRGVIVSTAGTVSDRSRAGRPSSYNVITVSPTAIEVVTRVWSRDDQDFVPGPHQSFGR